MASLLYNFILNSVSELVTGILQFIAVVTFQMSFTDTALGNLIYTLFLILKSHLHYLLI